MSIVAMRAYHSSACNCAHSHGTCSKDSRVLVARLRATLAPLFLRVSFLRGVLLLVWLLLVLVLLSIIFRSLIFILLLYIWISAP